MSGPDGARHAPPPEEPDRPGMGPTPAGVLVGWGLAGLLLGRLLRPASGWVGTAAPLVTWPQPLALLAVAAVLAAVARATRRSVTARRPDLPSHHGVNRLLLARASALVGALVAGGYAGYALAWLGSDAALADQRVVRSLVSVAAALAVVAASMLLERACRVRDGDPDP